MIGYFTNGHRMTTEELEAVQGRGWEEYVALFLAPNLSMFFFFPHLLNLWVADGSDDLLLPALDPVSEEIVSISK